METEKPPVLHSAWALRVVRRPTSRVSRLLLSRAAVMDEDQQEKDARARSPIRSKLAVPKKSRRRSLSPNMKMGVVRLDKNGQLVLKTGNSSPRGRSKSPGRIVEEPSEEEKKKAEEILSQELQEECLVSLADLTALMPEIRLEPAVEESLQSLPKLPSMVRIKVPIKARLERIRKEKEAAKRAAEGGGEKKLKNSMQEDTDWDAILGSDALELPAMKGRNRQRVLEAYDEDGAMQKFKTAQ